MSDYDPLCYACRKEAARLPAGVQPTNLCLEHAYERIAELEQRVQGYYNEASKGWTKFRETERRIAELEARIRKMRPYDGQFMSVQEHDEICDKLHQDIACLREALKEIANHSVCCDARHVASAALTQQQPEQPPEQPTTPAPEPSPR